MESSARTGRPDLGAEKIQRIGTDQPTEHGRLAGKVLAAGTAGPGDHEQRDVAEDRCRPVRHRSGDGLDGRDGTPTPLADAASAITAAHHSTPVTMLGSSLVSRGQADATS